MSEIESANIKQEPAEDCDVEWHIPVARYEDNTIVVEAYNDPQLQPVVMMKRLDESCLSNLNLKHNFVAMNLVKTEDEECLYPSNQDVSCGGNEGAVSGSQCRNQLPRGTKNAQHSVSNKSFPSSTVTAKFVVASVTKRRRLGPITIRRLLESQTVDNPLDLEKLLYDVLRQDTRLLHSNHTETDVTNSPDLGGYKNVPNNRGDVPQLTEGPGRYASLVMEHDTRQQTPADRNSENTNSDVADLINSVVEVKVKGDTGVGDERQLTGTDTLTNEPSVKLTRDSVQGKTDVVVVSHTQTEYASEHGFAPHFTQQPKSSGFVRPYKCKICGFRFKQQSRLERHLNIHTRPYKCSFCNRKFAHEYLRKMHERSHMGTLPQCPVCGGRYICLQKHIENQHDDTVDAVKHVCSVCKKEFKKEKLKQHMLSHSHERPYSCQDCGKRFRTGSHLRTHSKSVHVKEKNHVCNVCGKGFAQSSALSAHMSTHSDDRPYSCEACGKAFKKKITLNAHQFTHLSEKRFTCDTCGKQFRRRETLQRHELIHSGVQPYECSVCGMKFNQSCSLTRHMLTHTGEKPYCCSDCGERFTQSGGLASHRRRHCPRKKQTISS